MLANCVPRRAKPPLRMALLTVAIPAVNEENAPLAVAGNRANGAWIIPAAILHDKFIREVNAPRWYCAIALFIDERVDFRCRYVKRRSAACAGVSWRKSVSWSMITFRQLWITGVKRYCASSCVIARHYAAVVQSGERRQGMALCCTKSRASAAR